MQKKLIALAALGALTSALPSAQGAALYTFESGAEGFHTKTFFYDTGREVVAFDAQFTPALAEASLKFLRERSASPLTFLVITHPNPDKFNGAPVYQAAGATVVASERTARAIPGAQAYKKNFFENVAKMFAPGQYPQEALIDQTFAESLSLPLASGAVLLRELPHPGVSGNQTVALLPELGALVVGDLVHSQAHAWLEGGIVAGAPRPSLEGWREDLRSLSSIEGVGEDTLILGGRGGALALKAAVPEQIAYLNAAEEIVKAYLAEFPGAEDAVKGPNAAAVYQALRERFEKEFPGRNLIYLVEYGIYGLVAAISTQK